MKTRLLQEQIPLLWKGFSASYSQIFFSENRFFALLLILVTFIHPYAGLAGAVAVLTSLFTVKLFGYDTKLTEKGIYGFNSLLTALCLGIFFEPSSIFLLLVIISSVFVVFLTVAIQGILLKYQLPFLSIPFLLAAWILLLAARSFGALDINARGIYVFNELYKLGGRYMVTLYEISQNLELPASIKIYLESLGAILFQYNLPAGILIASGLLLYSRIAFSLSLLGFYSAWLFYHFIGADISSMAYSYIGFNYILTAIALGGYFYLPSVYSYLLVILLSPMVAFVLLGFQNLLQPLQLPVYSLPFNFIVLLFLYAFRFRVFPARKLREVIVQRHSPEENLYSATVSYERFRFSHLTTIKLPFWGEWTVYQGYNGEHTHQEDWRFAWDFVITDPEKRQYSGDGTKPEDFYCFGKPVLAPADGEIAAVLDGIEDNFIGEVNLIQNWGNTVVIKHHASLYTQLSHLKKGSIKVKVGNMVKAGQVIAACGNSGRSPFPHLHFQMQATPMIGSKTIEYPISHYIVRKGNITKAKSFGSPAEQEIISSVEIHPLLDKAFHLTPGQKISITFVIKGKEQTESWEVLTNIYNQPYLWCAQYTSAAYFINDGILFRFTHFEGSRKSLLYMFYLAHYEVLLAFNSQISIRSDLPVYQVFSRKDLFFPDFIAPFFSLLHARYTLRYAFGGQDFSFSEIRLRSEVVREFCNKAWKRLAFETILLEDGISKIIVYDQR